MKHLAAFILIAALLVLLALALTESRADPAPLVHAAWQQPEQRLFNVCPLDRRNLPRLDQRSA